jgi:glycosyltransferase involved in cell wall biosynthesis
MRMEDRIDQAYEGLATLADEFFSMIATSLEKDVANGDTTRLVKNLSAALPALFLAAPFFTSLRHLHRDKEMLRSFRDSVSEKPRTGQKKLLWFSDTVTDLNGVAVTMRELGARAHETGRPFKLVTSLAATEDASSLPPNTVHLPCIYSITPEFYTSFTLRVPSLLRSIDIIADEHPEEIVISTPGPVGLLGLIAARLLDVKCIGVYHTDFARQADHFIGDPAISAIIEAYTRGFFRLVDEVRVPTQRYIDMLTDRGLDPARMKLFRRGIDPSFAVEDASRRDAIRSGLKIPEDRPVLLWAGRLGKEKNLDVLMNVYRETARRRPGTMLLVAGNGPELERLKAENRQDPNVCFAGRVDRRELPHYYSLADVFVFPSTTDTFGMVVLEAQACGLPAIVTDVGGPQEIIEDGETGFVVPADDFEGWVSAVVGLIDMKARDPDHFKRMSEQARRIARIQGGWDALLDDMMGPAPTETDRAAHTRPASPEPALTS